MLPDLVDICPEATEIQKLGGFRRDQGHGFHMFGNVVVKVLVGAGVHGSCYPRDDARLG